MQYFSQAVHMQVKIEHECHKLENYAHWKWEVTTLIIEDASDAILNHLTIVSFITQDNVAPAHDE